MEHVGYQMGHIHGTVHNEAYYWVKWEQRKGRILSTTSTPLSRLRPRMDAGGHRRLRRRPHYFTYVNEKKGWESWPYDQPFHLILNIAVGGWWGRSGGGIDDAIFPQQMLVDYVRVYERASTN